MEIIKNILIIFLYVLVLVWIISKIREMSMLKKVSDSNKYKEVREKIKDKTFSKIMYIVIFILLVIVGIYFVGAIIVSTMISYMASEILFAGPEEFIAKVARFSDSYFKVIDYRVYIGCIIGYVILVKGIYTNIEITKKLKVKAKEE